MEKSTYYCDCGWQRSYPAGARVNCPLCKRRAVELQPNELAPEPKDHHRKWRTAAAVKTKCKHLGERRSANGESEVLKVLCQTCKGLNNIYQPVFSCAVHKRCLPHFQPVGEAFDHWYGNQDKGIERRFEADLYHACRYCQERELIEISPPTSNPLSLESTPPSPPGKLP